MPKIKRPTLHHFNNFLTVLVVVVCLYVLVFPFWPSISLWLHKRTDKTDGFVYQNNISIHPAAKSVPPDNRIVVPGLLIDEPIKEGRHISVINNGGTWHRPASSDPSKGGNTVIIGHRFTYRGSSVFYNLDKLKVGDPIIVYWQGREYDYKVIETKTVPPNTPEIEKQTDDTRLTLYTCTPLVTAKNRLVVTALPINGEKL